MAELYWVGLKEYRAALRQIDTTLGPEMRRGLNEVADLVAGEAKALVPHRTGRAADSIKAGSTQTAAQLKVGGTRAPYYPWLDFGGAVGRRNSVRRPYLRGGRYVYPTVARKTHEIVELLEDVLERLAEKAGF